MLGRRELSEVQVRQRLARRGHAEAEIDSAVARLKEERAIDDARVAAAIARTQVGDKRRGRLRVTRQIQSAGITPSVARQAVDSLFQSVDAAALLESALAKRLRGRDRAADPREFRRLYRYLITQGFEPDRVMAALEKRRPVSDDQSG